jgi:hypothetical protein
VSRVRLLKRGSVEWRLNTYNTRQLTNSIS